MNCFFSNRKNSNPNIRIFDQISDFSTKNRTLSYKISRKTARVTAYWQDSKLICRDKPQNKDICRNTWVFLGVAETIVC